MAFDADGRRLRKADYSETRGNQKKIYFWGLPATFTIDGATQKIKKTIAFELQPRPVDEAGYAEFKKNIENYREIVQALSQIATARRRDQTQYGDDIAGLYYLYDAKKQNPWGSSIRKLPIPIRPTFCLRFDQVYMKPLNGTRLSYLPEDYFSNGWVEVRLVEG